MSEPESKRAIDTRLELHMAHEEDRNKANDLRLEKIEADLEKISQSIDGLLKAWNAANTIGNFLKWVAGIGAGVTIIVELFRNSK